MRRLLDAPPDGATASPRPNRLSFALLGILALDNGAAAVVRGLPGRARPLALPRTEIDLPSRVNRARLFGSAT